LAGLHVERMVSTWEDMDRTIAVVSRQELAAYNKTLSEAAFQVGDARR
jgi:hypothetical protein